MANFMGKYGATGSGITDIFLIYGYGNLQYRHIVDGKSCIITLYGFEFTLWHTITQTYICQYVFSLPFQVLILFETISIGGNISAIMCNRNFLLQITKE